MQNNVNGRNNGHNHRPKSRRPRSKLRPQNLGKAKREKRQQQ